MSKFVGKFRKNKDYNDDYNYASTRRHRNEHSEIKKLITQSLEEENFDEVDEEEISQYKKD